MRDREERLPADTPVRVVFGGRQRRGCLRNVSPGGALLDGIGMLAADTHVTICYLGHELPARVAWSAGGKAGIRFLTPLTRDELVPLQGSIAHRLAS